MEHLQGELVIEVDGVLYTLRFDHRFLGVLGEQVEGGLMVVTSKPGVAMAPEIIRAACTSHTLTIEEVRVIAGKLDIPTTAQLLTLYGHSVGFFISVLEEMSKLAAPLQPKTEGTTAKKSGKKGKKTPKVRASQ